MIDPLIALLDQLIFLHGNAVAAHRVMSVKDYDELCRRIVCHPVTPCSVALGRLKELTEAES